MALEGADATPPGMPEITGVSLVPAKVKVRSVNQLWPEPSVAVTRTTRGDVAV